MLPKRLVIPEGYTTLERSAFDGLDLREGGCIPLYPDHRWSRRVL